MDDAKDKGVFDQVVAAAKAFSVAPVDLLANALGTAAPVIAAGLATTLGGAPALIATGARLGVGAMMGAGTTKGAIYDATKDALKENTNLSDKEIEARAVTAQEYGGKNLDNYCNNWKEQLRYIMTDLYNTGTYKLTMYPHCHFVQEGQMKTIDWYGCVPVEHPFIDAEYMDGIIHESAKFRLAETGAIVNNKYNLEIMFKRSMQEHVRWGTQNMEYIYKEIVNA
jgi:hypothetical protein